MQCPVKTIHLNAQLAPVYGMNESAQLANKLEYLMKNAENEKTVFFGSCSTWYGINVNIFREKTNRLSFNMGVEGDTCALFQLDIIKQYMRKNDTLVYICDMGSPFLMLYDVTMAPRAYRLVEFNYDLLSTVDLTRYEKVISALNEYLVIKHNEISFGNAGTYEDCLGYISEYGDMELTREGSTHNNIYTAVSPQVIKEKDTFDKMKPVFQNFADMGIDIYFGFGTISEDAISDEIAVELNNLFVSGIKEKNIPVTLIAEFYTAILPTHLFYDYPYRLNSEGSYYYTQLFIDNFLYASSRNKI